MEVILKLTKKDSWSGVYKYKDCKDYTSSYFTRSGNLYTGLTKEDEVRLEKELGYVEGHLSPKSSFWKTFSVILGAKEKILHTEYPMDELQYLFLKNHKRVANGLKYQGPGKDYLLINKNTEAEEANKHNQVKIDAIVEFKKLSMEQIRKCLRLFGYRPDSMSDDMARAKLFEEIENNPSSFFTKWVNNKARETEYILNSAVAKNIIRKSRTSYYYGTDMIGNSKDDAISYLDDKKNQDLKMTILQEIEVK